MAEACEEVCKGENRDSRICFSLVIANELSTPKLGENGHGIFKKPQQLNLQPSQSKGMFYTQCHIFVKFHKRIHNIKENRRAVSKILNIIYLNVELILQKTILP